MRKSLTEQKIEHGIYMTEFWFRCMKEQQAFALRLAERIYLAHEVLGKVAEKRPVKPVVMTEIDYCPL